MPVFLLTDHLFFPPPHLARKDGLLAMGGDLSVERLLLAYKMGIFPWYMEGEPPLWWSPDPRLILYPGEMHIPRSLRKVLRKDLFRLTLDQAFTDVISACADIRTEDGGGTWITREMIQAYIDLHEAGFAHSVETWIGDRLVGGLYGVSLGGGFFGESMFSRVSDASKVALAALVAHLGALGFDFVDCQVRTDHLVRLGAREIPRRRFLGELARAIRRPTLAGKWNFTLRTDLVESGGRDG